MANNEQFQASVVAGIETPGSAEAAKIFGQLLDLVEKLQGSAKTSGKALVEAFTAGKAPEELASKIRILQRELKFLGTVNKGAELFKSDEVTKVNEINRAIAAAARAYDSMRQSQALARYELGLDSKTAAEAAANMKILERNLKAVDLALQKDSGNTALLEKKKLLTDNHALLGVVINDLKQQATQEKLNEDIAKANHAAQQQRYTEVQRLTRQRKQEEGSASAQTRVSNAQFDYSQQGRDYGAMRTRLQGARIDQQMLPGQEQIAMNRLTEQTTKSFLTQAYKDAGLTYATISATLRDGAKVRQLVAEIRTLEAQMVNERAKGNVNLQQEAQILDQIRNKTKEIANVRVDQNLNDPATRQARQDAQSRNILNRAGGEGGAALLALQASLMANYSILNNTVGAMKAAISTSVELEAAFRNVQAVTGTSATEMSGLEERIKSVAASSKFSSIEVANAALILGQAGLSARQVGEALGPVVTLANAAGTSIANAVDLVTSIIGVFDKTTANIADIANKVTQAANSSKISVEKLALAFQYVGNAASQSGISFEETTAALSAMSNAGIKSGSTMGTGLRQFLTETEKPSKEFLAALQRIGLSLSDIDFKSNGLIGVVRKIREAGFIASDAIKSFDVRGAAAFNALIANPDELERQYRLLQDTNAATEANAIQMDSLQAQSKRLTTSLGNLASSGFEPVSKLLAVTFGGFASLTQAISEHNIVVGVAGTVLAGLAASSAVSFLASMAAGALRLTATAGTASVAVTALQTASKAGSLGTLLAGIQASVMAMGTIPPVAATATTATLTLRGALASLSIVSGIGIAVAALTAAYYAYEYVTNRTAKEIDALKAATNSSKGAFEEKDQAVQSLTKKIEDLTYREFNLRNNTEGLRTESLALTSQFGAIGYQADSTSSSFDTMIGKLRSLKTEMEGVRKLSLEKALGDNETLLRKQTEQLKDSVKDAQGGFLNPGVLRRMDSFAKLEGLTGSDRSKIQAATTQLRGGDINNMADVSGARLVLQRIASAMEGTKDSNKLTINTLRDTADQLGLVSTNLSEVGKTRSEIAALTGTANRNQNWQNFNNSGRFGASGGKPLTFEASLPRQGNLETIALQAAGQPDERDPMKVFDIVKVEFDKRAKAYEAQLKKLKDENSAGTIDETTFETARQLINSGREKDKNAYLELVDATTDQATNTYQRAKRLLDSKIKNARIKNDRSTEKELEDKLATLETEFRNRAETSAIRASTTAEQIAAQRDQNIQNIEDRRQRSQGRNVNADLQERSLKVQAGALDSAANAQRSGVKTAQTMDEVSDLLDKAIESKFEAKRKRLQALVVKQRIEAQAPGYDAKTGDLAHRLEREALDEGENEKIKTFADSFISLIEAAMGRLDSVTKRILETKRRIDTQKLDSEDRIFESQQALREAELSASLGKRTRNWGPRTRTRYGESDDPARTTFTNRGVSADLRGTGSSMAMASVGQQVSEASVNQGIRETVNMRRARLILESTKVELEENEKALKEYGDNTTGYIGDLTAKYNEAKNLAVEVRERLKTATDEKLKSVLTASLAAYEKTETDSFRDLRSARTERQRLQVENFNIQKRGAENTEALPQEVNIENLLDKLDEVWAKYQGTVGQMDTMKVLGQGLEATLGGVTGSLGNAFASIVTGTKTVKGAFKDMAASIVKSMIDILSQALAMQAVKGIMSLLGFGSIAGGGAGLGGATTIETGASFATMAASGGLIVPGGIQRVKKMAGGGPVTGGVANKDSVPTILMPGEFVMRKSAVDAVGTDYLHSLNAAANGIVSASSPKVPASSAKSGEDNVVNVWVVTPDQQPSGMGPKDIVAIISDDINRGGSVKKLIKQVVNNQV